MERLSISVHHSVAVLAPHQWSAYNLTVQSARAVSSVVRAPRSHRGGRRFKSSIAHHAAWTNQTESWPSCQALACRGGGTADALRSGRSVLTDVWVQIPPSAPKTISKAYYLDGLRLIARFLFCACSSVDRAPVCGTGGRGFKSRQAHHNLGTKKPSGCISEGFLLGQLCLFILCQQGSKAN